MNIELLFEGPGPMLVTPGGDASMAALCEYLQAAGRTLFAEHGCVLLRGFAVDSATAFDRVAEAAGARPMPYVGGNSPRTQIAERVYTSTEYPSSESISLHNEMSYLPSWPSRLLFFSEIPAQAGGQTSLADGRRILAALPDQIVDRFRARGLRYIRHFPAKPMVGKSWQWTYQTDDRDEVEAILRQQNSTCEWSSAGALKVMTVCPATTLHPVLNFETWFNQAEQWHPSALPPALRTVFERAGMLAHDCEHGDGSPLDEGMLATIRTTVNACKLLFDWQRGDVLIIDNVRFLHGREPFKGARRTLAYLSAN